jgi:cytochrome P450
MATVVRELGAQSTVAPARPQTLPSRAEPPGPEGIHALSAFIHMRRNRLQFIQTMRDRYGAVSRLAIGGRRLVLVSSKSGILQVLKEEVSKYQKGMGFAEGKEFFGDGLVTSEAETWRLQRTTLSPYFRNSTFSAWSGPMKANITQSIDWIRERGSSRRGINLDQCIGDLACNILGSTILGAPLESRRLRQALLVVDEYVNKKMTAILPEPPVTYLRYKRSIRHIRKVTKSVIEHNKSQGRSTSLVSYMLSEDRPLLNVWDQTSSFLLAGHDNTTSLICWTLLLLAANPSVQENLRRSLIKAWRDTDLSLKMVEDQRYACATLFEAMRLFPPVWAIPRQAVVDTEIDGLQVSTGSKVLLFPFLVHRNAEDWPDPERFDPTRFLHDNNLTMLALLAHLQKDRMFVPFGFGPRACIGFQHALVESIAVVTALIQSFQVAFPAGAGLQPGIPRLSLRPHHNARLLFTPIVG